MGQQTEGPRWLLAVGTACAGVLGLATLWVSLALWTDLACGWMALVAAVDHVVLQRLVRTPEGRWRTGLVVVATVATVVASAWLIVAAQLGTVLGFRPIASALRLGPVLAWEYTRMGFSAWDWGCVAFAPLLAIALDARRPAGR